MAATERIYNIGTKARWYTHGGKDYVIPPKNGVWKLEIVEEMIERDGKVIRVSPVKLVDKDPAARDRDNWCYVPKDLVHRLFHGDLNDSHYEEIDGRLQRALVHQDAYEGQYKADLASVEKTLIDKQRKLREIEEALAAAEKAQADAERASLIAEARAGMEATKAPLPVQPAAPEKKGK